MRKKALIFAIGIVVLFSGIAMAKHLAWEAPNQYTDGTAIPSPIQGTMKYYIRTKAANPVSTNPDGTGWYYLGETPANNTTNWPPGNDLESGMAEGTSRTYTVTATYRDANGDWHESGLSGEVILSIPFQAGEPPVAPTNLTIQD